MIAVSQCYSPTSVVASNTIESYRHYQTKPHYEISSEPLSLCIPSREKDVNHPYDEHHGLQLNRYALNTTSQLSSCSGIQHLPTNDTSPRPFDGYRIPREPHMISNDLNSDDRSRLAPLDLSCNKSDKLGSRSGLEDKETFECDEPKVQPPINITSGVNNVVACIGNTSPYSSYDDTIGYRFSDEVARRQKRRDQNKAAAQSYRQRKKSITDLIETEHDIALKRNKQLMAYRATLEAEIVRMRSLLQDIANTKKEKEETKIVPISRHGITILNSAKVTPENTQFLALDFSKHTTGKPHPIIAPGTPCQQKADVHEIYEGSLPSSTDSQASHSVPTSPNSQSSGAEMSWSDLSTQFALKNNREFEPPIMRPRQNTWPMDRNTIRLKGLEGKDRKKEQNRLASRRFRVRRKVEMSVNEVQLMALEKRNVKLNKVCDDYTKKIAVIKEVLEQLGCRISSSFAVSNNGSGKGSQAVPILMESHLKSVVSPCSNNKS